MSLLLWLPLTNNTENYGLADFGQPTFQNSTMAQDSSGKLGMCYKGVGLVYHTTAGYVGNKWTVAMWVKNSAWSENNDILLCLNVSSPNHCQIYFSIVNGARLNLGINDASGIVSYSYTFNADEWYHVAATYDEMHYALYINGNQVKADTSIRDPFYDCTNIGIGLRSNDANGTTQAGINAQKYMNDVRLYDHALSPREIKEISNGLVLHYPLNNEGFGNDNLLKLPNHTIFHNSNNSSTYPIAREFLTENGFEYERVTRKNIDSNPTTFSIYGCVNKTIIDPSVTAGTTVTVTIWARCSHEQTTTKLYLTQLGPGSSAVSLNSPVTVMEPNKWTKFTLTTTIEYSYGDIDTGSRGWDISVRDTKIPSGEISNFYFDFRQDYKVEVGSESTPWSPNPEDDLYEKLGLSSNVIYDVSGYQNNGELYAVGSGGTFNIVSGSPRYKTAINPHSENSTSNSSNGTVYIKANCELATPKTLTISFWAYVRNEGYRSSASNGLFCTTSTNGGDYLASAMNHRDAGIDVNNSSANSHLRLSIPLITDEWHHYVFTYDGRNAKSYRDGVLQDTKSFTSDQLLGSFTNVFLGFSFAGGVWRRNNNSYSDLRIYATALSQDDILSLYNAPISISNSGVLFANEFVEVM